MKKQRLAFVLFNYHPYGGLQRDCWKLAEKCLQAGFEVDILTRSWQGEHLPGANIIILSVNAWQNHVANQRFINKALGYIGNHQYECVIGFNKMSGLDIYYAADPCLATKLQQRSWLLKLLPRYRNLLKQEQAIFSPDKKTEVLCISPRERQHFIDYYHTETQRLHCLPPGINKKLADISLSDTEKLTLKQQLGVEPQDNIILLVGSGFRTKGLDRAIYALSALPEAIKRNTKLLVVGKDDPRSFKQLAKKLGVEKHIVFTGPRSDVGAIYHIAKGLIHPAYSENTGTVLLEAMVCGLPVIVTVNCGYAHYILDAKAGLVTHMPYQQVQLNQQLNTLLTNAKARQQWRDNGLNYIKHHNFYSLFDKALEIIKHYSNEHSYD